MAEGVRMLDWDSAFAGDGRLGSSHIEAVNVEKSALVSEDVGPMG